MYHLKDEPFYFQINQLALLDFQQFFKYINLIPLTSHIQIFFSTIQSGLQAFTNCVVRYAKWTYPTLHKVKQLQKCQSLFGTSENTSMSQT